MITPRRSCLMSWTHGRGIDGVHNTFLNISTSRYIMKAMRSRQFLFARKFSSVLDRRVLDMIDDYEVRLASTGV